MKSKDAVVAVISDIHAGSTTAVCPLRWQLFDGGTYHASPAQRIIHRQWRRSGTVVSNLLNEYKERKRLILILNGEPIDGDHHGTTQLITKNKTEQIDMSIALLDEWLQIVDYQPKHGDSIYLVRGTSAHERGEHINQIGRDIDGVIPYRKDKSPLIKDGRYYHLKLRRKVNGVLFDIAHHGFTRGSRSYTKSNTIRLRLISMYFACLNDDLPIPKYVIRLRLISMYFACLNDDLPIPKYVIRSHKHYYTHATYEDKKQDMWGCITPSWQIKTHYGNQAAANDPLNTIGMIYFDVNESGSSKEYTEFIEMEDTPVREF